MGKVIANITTSIDGYVAGPDDGPDQGLGKGGERLHYWVFGGPWTYDNFPDTEMTGEDKAYFDEIMARTGAVIAGRASYDGGGGWGGTSPWGVPCFVVTHRTDDEPEEPSFTFVDGFQAALEQARAAAGDRDVLIMGGADLIRQGLAAGVVEELGISVSPLILGAGKGLFDGFDRDVELATVSVRQSPFATHVWYAVSR